MSGPLDKWLTVETVEDIQRAVQKGRPVADFVRGIRYSTLPGLLEFGCLRWAIGGEVIPRLPHEIEQSQLGQALKLVPSPLGLATDGAQRTPLNRIDAQPVEFFTVS